jgi:hypothetical protein
MFLPRARGLVSRGKILVEPAQRGSLNQLNALCLWGSARWGRPFIRRRPAGCVAAAGRLELARRLLAEAEEYLAKGDAVQSSEKLYKAAEECIKALAERLNLKEVREAEEKGRWTVTLLEKAVGKLVDKLGVDVEFGWAEANYLHVWGFHEAKLDVEDVKRRIPIIRRLVDLAQET